MAHVFRQHYTIPVPDGAARTMIKDRKGRDRPAVRFKGPDGKPVVAPLTRDDENRCLVPSPCWYGWVPDPEAAGGRRREKLCTNRTAAEQMLADLVKKAEMAKAGIRDPYEAHRGRPLAEHLADFRRHLEAKGDAPAYVGLVCSRLTELFAGCGWRTCADLSGSAASAWLADLRQKGGRDLPPLDPAKVSYTAREAAAVLGIKPLSVGKAVARLRLEAAGQGKARRFPRATVEALRERLDRGRSVQTTNYYLSHLKSFCRWLVRDRRMGDNPLAHLGPANAGVDRRHDRRELSADELRRLLAATRGSGRTFRGLAGADRYALYAAACGTGFRAGGLASLTPASFGLDADPPTVTLAARRNKSRVLKVQPLPADVAELLRDYLAGRPAGASVWPGTWVVDAAEMLRIDLEAAGIPYAVEGPDGPLYADFHALRHTYLTLGGRAGIDLRTLQELAGHSTPTLTARYSHRRLYDLAGAVERLPNFLPDGATEAESVALPAAAALPATGTDGAHFPPRLSGACPALVQDSVPRRSPAVPGGTETSADQDPAADPNPSAAKGLEPIGADRSLLGGMKALGLEPRTYGLKVRCSTD